MSRHVLVEDEVMASVRHFAGELQATEEVSRFHQLEHTVNESPRVQGLIEEIKRKQKELVHAKHYAKSEYRQMLETELDQLHHELDNLPVVREYQQTQVEMNDLLQLIQDMIGSEVSKKIDVETGGEARSGCGGGGSCNCK